MQKLSLFLVWSVFKFELQADDHFKIVYEIEDGWIIRQKNKIRCLNGKVVFVIADKFIKTVYDVGFSEDKKKGYINNLSKTLGVPVMFESEAVKKYWSLEEYVKVSSNTNFAKDVIESEILRRRCMYNPSRLKIEEEIIQKLAIKALGCYKAEQTLEKEMRLSFWRNSGTL